MQGWSLFKQGRLEEALHPFFGVLDLKVADRRTRRRDLESMRRPDARRPRTGGRHLPRHEPEPGQPAGRRVDSRRTSTPTRGAPTSSASTSSSASSTSSRTASRTRPTPSAAFARRNPLHAQAPLLQARVIEIYQRTGFANLALEAKKDYVSRYGVDSEFRRANPAGWERAQPLVKTHLAELARHYHASGAEEQGQRRLPGGGALVPRLHRVVPGRPRTRRRTTSCSPNCCSRTARFAEAAVEYEKTAYRIPAHMHKAPTPAMPRCWATPARKSSAGAADLPDAAARRRGQCAALRQGRSRPTRAPAPC